MKVEIRLKKLPGALKSGKLEGAARVAVKEGASKYKEMVLDYIDEGKAFKNRTGVLRESIVAVGNKVFAYAKYAPFVEFGTRPHVILPKRKKALRFFKDGKEVIVKKVNHPGSKPYPFFYADMERRKEEVAREFLRRFLEELVHG